MIVILKGGISAEREVSLWTAKTVADALRRLERGFIEIDAAAPDWLDQVCAAQPNMVLIALHGPFGEDGQVQQALDDAGIRYTGSGPAASAFAMNKDLTKQRAAEAGIAIPESQLVRRGESAVWTGAYPVMVKPNGDGSSFGITRVTAPADLDAALADAFRYGSEVLVEEYVAGTEVSCGVIETSSGLSALPLVEIRPRDAFFTFEAKYEPGRTEEICPAPLPVDVTALVQEQSLQLFSLLGLRHYARADWIIRTDTPYFLEFNTLPGMTKTSLLNKELAAAGIPFHRFIAGLLEPEQLTTVSL